MVYQGANLVTYYLMGMVGFIRRTRNTPKRIKRSPISIPTVGASLNKIHSRKVAPIGSSITAVQTLIAGNLPRAQVINEAPIN